MSVRSSPSPSPSPSPERTTPLSIAILLNSYRSPFITEIRDSYIRSIQAVSGPRSSLTFFYPAESDSDEEGFPDPNEFDLIVVGGGNADPRRKHPWILRVHRFILDVVANHPRKKLCGICWGHQTISMLFGGEVVDMEQPELGVTEANLTPAGARFFLSRPSPPSPSPPHGSNNNGIQTKTNNNTHNNRKRETIRLQQHHRRHVSKPPRGFTELLADHQAFLSHNNAILTFQGHPEKDARAAKVRIRDAARWFGTDMADQRAVNELLCRMEIQHDGREVWERVLRWVWEGVA